MHRNTGDTESIIVEYGFIDSTGDDAYQIQNNWKKYAEAVVKAITEYAGYNYYPEKEGIYVVKKGDTLYSIAQKYGVSLNDLKRLNKLDSNTISIGQILTIPGLIDIDDSNIGNTYIVKRGDTLYSIAKIYNTTINKIKEVNNLTSNILSIGQELIIPIDSYDTYEVKSGDTLYSIARKFGTTIDEIKNINNLISNLLSISQIIKIPIK